MASLPQQPPNNYYHRLLAALHRQLITTISRSLLPFPNNHQLSPNSDYHHRATATAIPIPQLSFLHRGPAAGGRGLVSPGSGPGLDRAATGSAQLMGAARRPLNRLAACREGMVKGGGRRRPSRHRSAAGNVALSMQHGMSPGMLHDPWPIRHESWPMTRQGPAVPASLARLATISARGVSGTLCPLLPESRRGGSGMVEPPLRRQLGPGEGWMP